MGRQENVEIFEDTFALCEQNSTLRNAIEQSTKKQKLYRKRKGGNTMRYIVKEFDKPLLIFSAERKEKQRL